MAKASKRKVGRPAKYPKPRIPLSFRLQAHIYDEIKQGAEHSGRSISEEIERRIERRYEEEKAHEQNAATAADIERDLRNQLNAANDLIAKLENLQLNWRSDMQAAIESAFQKAGLTKPKDGQQ